MSRTVRLSLRFATAALGMWLAAMGAASAQTAVREYRISQQSLDHALREFALASNLDLLFSPDLVAGKKSPTLDGKFTVDEGLRTLLRGSGLEFSVSGSRIVIGEAKEAPARQATSSTSSISGTNGYTRLAQAEDDTETSSGPPSESSQAPRNAVLELEEIIVTGTNIVGVKDKFSPVTTIGREGMDLAGHANVADVLSSLPQNFGGGATAFGSVPGARTGVGGSSVNLRGLGNEATLVLLNGRRLAPGGRVGDFVDVSAIPTSAIDRIEVLTDGASAIYGSDAIAGVVNIILRSDFDGAETRLNLSTVTDGGSDTIKAGQTFGASSGRAHGLLTYEYSSEDALEADDKAFARSLPQPNDLAPDSSKHSVFASGSLELSDRTRLSADGFYNKRESSADRTGMLTGVRELEAIDLEQFGAAAAANLRLSADWEGELSAAYSRSDHGVDYAQAPRTSFSNSKTEIASVDAKLSGELFHLSDEAVRAVLGVHHRSESADILLVQRPASPAASLDVDKRRTVSAAYGELYAPLVSEADTVRGVNRLAFMLAARYDDYSDFGSSFDPKVGVLWSPFAGLDLRSTYGTSFRAPRLEQLRDVLSNANLGVFADPLSQTGTSVALDIFGQSSDLDPEQAETWTAGFDFAPEFLERFRLSGTYFNIVYEDRIASPSHTLNSQFLFANFTGLPIRNPSAETVQALANSAASFLNLGNFFPSLGALQLQDVTVILDRRPQNVSASSVAGVDLEVSYEVPSDFGAWTFFVNSTFLSEYTEQFSAATPVADLLDTFGNPVDLKLRGGIQWRTASLTASLYVNHIDGYTDDEASAGPTPIDSWTTIDVTMRFDLGQVFDAGIADGAFLSLSATNIFNRDPPGVGFAPLRGVLYDAANADALGRSIGILLTKRWDSGKGR